MFNILHLLLKFLFILLVTIIVFDIRDVTFANVYLPSGNDTLMSNLREDYLSLSIPQLLINHRDNGCIGVIGIVSLMTLMQPKKKI